MRKREKNKVVFPGNNLLSGIDTFTLSRSKSAAGHKGKQTIIAVPSNILSFSLGFALYTNETEEGIP